MTPPRESLTEREVHVWLTHPERIREPERLAAYDRLLTADERRRGQRFRFERDRHAFLVTRALVRTVLSRYEDVDPADWRFVTRSHGRPELAPDMGSRMRFNLSHTDGLIACAVALERDVGVDVEASDRRAETTEIADRFFSPSEVEELRALAPHLQRARFFTYWTLKEAYIKARGLGLAIPLDGFSFHLRENHPISISFDERVADEPLAWQFRQEWPTDRHSLATCVARRGADLRITVRELVPPSD